MFEILQRRPLNPTVTLLRVLAPRVARTARPGQFIILRVDADGERIPLTVEDYDREAGWVEIVFQIVGATTERLNRLREGDCLHDFVGPLGRPTETEGLSRVAVIGGGVGCAIALPVARQLCRDGAAVDSVIGFRTRGLVIFEDEFRAVSDGFRLMTDDGTAGEKGLVTDALRALIESGRAYDRVFAVGPLVMMKFVCRLTAEYGIPTVVSMNPIMIDGTGMCGGCRLTVGGKTRFACVDGPDFDGHLVDFDEAISRASLYRDEERRAHEKTCRLLEEADKHG
ncbi:MAG: sulfide/dihydroorotate dehydrogenase-like FAD/NAD-binding protein [Clostridia bacterium]|nr:sulfide/dihydroorotate dehydrogenase-like FAD/NAD-binding protein [Clostridia bacterium]